MARTGLTWTLKLNDAMSGSAKKIADSLGKVQGALDKIDSTEISDRELKFRQRQESAALRFKGREQERAASLNKRLDELGQKSSKRSSLLKSKLQEKEASFAEKASELTFKQIAKEKSKIAKIRQAIADQEEKQAQRSAKLKASISEKYRVASEKRIAKFESTTSSRSRKFFEREAKIKARISAKLEREAADISAKRAERIKGGLRTAAGLGVMAGMAAAGLVAAGVSAAVPAIVEAQKFKQATMFAFEALLKDSGKAKDAWSRAEKVARSTGMSLQETASSMNALLAQGMAIDEVEELTKRFADLKAINPSANIEGIARAMMQIKATGRLQGDELMQLNEAGLSSDRVYAQLEKRLGKTRAEVLKLQEAGKISSKDAIEAIKAALAEQTGKPAGKVAEEMARKTLGGAIGRLKAELDVLAGTDSPAFEEIAGAINRIIDALQAGKGKKVFDALTQGFERLGKLFGGISDSQINEFLTRLSQAITGLFFVMEIAIRIARTMHTAISALTSGVGSAVSKVLEFGSAITTAFSSIEGFKTAINTMIEAIRATGEAFFGTGTSLGESLIRGLVQAVLNGGGLVVSAITRVATEAVKSAMKEFEGISVPSFGGAMSVAATGDSLMTGTIAAREVKGGSSSTRNFSPTVNVNVSGGASNTGGITSAIGDALRSLNNAFA